MRFEFATATRILFGPGTCREIGRLAGEYGRNPLIVHGRDASRAEPLRAALRASGLASTAFAIAHEPTTDDIVRAVAQARAGGNDLVIGFGGGAALDAAKAIAALLTNEGDLFDYLEVIGGAKPLTRPAAPCIAIPTTAGTGSEVTRNAVLTSPAHRVKVSLRSASMLPRLALIDPELTHSLPAAVTAATGLDALTQLIEPYVSLRANPCTDAFCVEGIRRVAGALLTAIEHGGDVRAREDMALASLFGGLALANAGLGAVHGLAGPIGGMFPAPHGAVCAALLPHVMETNLAALRERASGSPTLPRYDEVARLLTGRAEATAADGSRWVSHLVARVQIPSLRHYGLTLTDSPAVVAAAVRASSMQANPVQLTFDELAAIFARAL